MHPSNTTIGLFPPFPHTGNATSSDETSAMIFSLSALGLYVAGMAMFLAYSNRHAISNTCGAAKNCLDRLFGRAKSSNEQQHLSTAENTFV